MLEQSYFQTWTKWSMHEPWTIVIYSSRMFFMNWYRTFNLPGFSIVLQVQNHSVKHNFFIYSYKSFEIWISFEHWVLKVIPIKFPTFNNGHLYIDPRLMRGASPVALKVGLWDVWLCEWVSGEGLCSILPCLILFLLK